MRIASEFGARKIWRRTGILLLVLLVIMPLGILRAEEPLGPVEVSAANVEISDGALILNVSLSHATGVRMFSLTSPDRLVFDFENAVLKLNPDAVMEWETPAKGVYSLEIAQFSNKPPVVRVVAKVADSSMMADKEVTDKGIRLAVYRGESPFKKSGPGAPPEQLRPTIERFIHEIVNSNTDKFTIDFSFGVVLPLIRIESPTIILLRFPGTDINLPESSPVNYSTKVGGYLVERMRAEKITTESGLNTEIRLTVKDTSAIGYSLKTVSDDVLELVIIEEKKTVNEPVAPKPSPIAGGQILVLSSGDNAVKPTDAGTHITRVQFQSIDERTDRFYLFYQGGSPEPRVQRFNYPTRVILYFPDTAVVLPDSKSDRFQTKVDGGIVRELKVFNRVIEDVGPECQFSFYFPTLAQEEIGFTFEKVSDTEFHVDFYKTARPIEISSPVEVNMSQPEQGTTKVIKEQPVTAEGVTAPAETPVVTAEEVAANEVTEVKPLTPVQETSASLPPVTPIEEKTAEPVEPPASLPVITVHSGTVNGNTITFTLTTTDPNFGVPEWIELKYPDRIGLKFPLSEVVLLNAKPQVYTSYTHIKAMPIVRAIIKAREGDKSTSIVWNLAGSLAEYSKEIECKGNEIKVIFHYNPLPELPPPVEETLVQEEPKEIPAAPAVETPVQPVEEIPVVEEPAPVPEVITEEETVTEVAEVKIPEPVPQVVETAPAIEVPPVVEETKIPVPQVPVDLPLIIVTASEMSDTVFTFNIETSEEMPIPQWVEFRYPDRLGLRFNKANVKLLDNPIGTVNVRTRIHMLPFIRVIDKTKPGDESTTVVWTLKGSLEEYARQLDWNGKSMRVTFTYQPVVVPEVPVVVPSEPTVETVAPVIETPVVQETPAPAVVEEIEEEIEEVKEPVVEKPVKEPTGEEVSTEKQPAKEIKKKPVEKEVVKEAKNEKPPVEETIIQPQPVEEEFPSRVVVTSVQFDSKDKADIITLTTKGIIGTWEVLPVNYPTKMLVRLPGITVDLGDGAKRHNQKVKGIWVDEYSIADISTPETHMTTLSIYAHAVESTEKLMYDIQAEGNKWSIAVFERGAPSPFEDRVAPKQEMLPKPVPKERDKELKPLPVVSTGGKERMSVESAVSEGGPKISMRLEDANIRDVLQLIAEQAGLNISIGPSVQGSITISLSEIGLFDLLDLLGSQLGFTYIVRSGVYIFGKSTELQSQFGAWPRWYISLSYADPDQVRSILISMGILSANQIQIYRGELGTTSVSIASPVLIILGEQKDLERAYRVIATVDQAPVMVQVDFQILNTSLTDNKNLGFQFDFGTGKYMGGLSLLFTEQASQNQDLGPFPQGFDRLRTAENVYTISYVINYLVENGYAEIMNRSSLTVANNQTGVLFVGETIPYRSTFQVSELGRVTQRVASQQVGLSLDFRPHANPDGTVTIVLRPQNSNLLELTDVGPRTVNQNFTTTVRVKDGEPFIIGGFIRDEKRVKYDRFPFLSDIPLLGHLFRNHEVKNVKSELIFVFTPHIIAPTPHLPIVRTDADLQVPIPKSIIGGY